jgi:hypothetical protein
MNDQTLEQAKARVQQALNQTQEQTEEAAAQLGGLLRKGLSQLKRAGDAAADAIRKDLNSRS